MNRLQIKKSLLFIFGIVLAWTAALGVNAAPKAPEITLTPGTKQIKISWNRVSTATNYKVKRKGPKESEYTDIANKLTGTSYTDKSLGVGTIYSYKVYAYDAQGNSSPVVSGKSMMTYSAKAVKLTTAKQGSDDPCHSIQLKWNKVSGATSYRIYRRIDGVSEYGSPYVTGIKDTSYLDTNKGKNLLAGTSYCYRVYAEYDGKECSPKPAGVWAHTKLYPPTVKIQDSGITTTTIEVKWTGVTGATSYQIDRAQGLEWKTIKTGLPSNRESYTDTGLSPGTNYRYRVYAVNKHGKSKAQEGTRAKTKGKNTVLTDGEYTFYTELDAAKAMSVVGANKSPGTNIHIYDNKGSTGQFFSVKNRGEGWFTIEYKAAGTVLDVKDQSKNSGANVLLNSYVKDRNSQLWKFTEAGNGTYYVENKLGCVLTIQGGKANNKANVNVETNKKAKAQRWRLYTTKDLKGGCVNLLQTSFDYTGNHNRPKVEVKVGNKYLKENTDYSLSYDDNRNAGKGYVDVKGMGSYKNSIVRKEFTINKAKDSISANDISVNASYTAVQSKTLNVSVKSGKSVSFKSDNSNVTISGGNVKIAKNWSGTANIVISTDDKGNYKKATKTIKVKANQIKNTISASNVTKDEASTKKEYSLKASCLGGATMKYESSNSKISAKNGKVAIPANWSGEATITITAEKKGIFKSTSKKITVKINKKKESQNGQYADYKGIDYTQLTSNSKRIAALNKAKEMTTIVWKCPVTFLTWSSSYGEYNSVKSISGKISSSFIKGESYQGIPYSMITNNYDDVKWMKLLKSGITASMMTGKKSGYPRTGTAKGIDCSRFVNVALKKTGYTVPYQRTADMLHSSYYKKISYSNMRPGDLFLKNGHVMMFVGKTGSKYAVFEATASGSKSKYEVYSYSDIRSYGAYTFVGYGD